MSGPETIRTRLSRSPRRRLRRPEVLLAVTVALSVVGVPAAHAEPGDLGDKWERAGTLRTGVSASNAVMSLQGYMMQSGYFERENRFIDAYERGTRRDCSTSYVVSVDGYFGGCTRAAVQGYQEDHGLATDGIVGPMTWRSLQSPAAHSPGCVADGRVCPYGSPDHMRPFSHDYRYSYFWGLWEFYYWPRNCWTDATGHLGGPCYQRTGGDRASSSPPHSATMTPLPQRAGHDH
jgi:hypothetical protein